MSVTLKNIILFSVTFLITGFFGCTTIKFSDSPLKPSSGDWLVPGGTPQKVNISFSDQTFSDELIEFWSYDVDAGFPKHALTVSDYIVFAATLGGKIYAVNIKTGSKAGSITARTKSLSSAPVINGNDLIYTTNGFDDNCLCSYNMIKGEENWIVQINRTETTPLFINGHIYFATVKGELICFKINEPSVIWNAKVVNRSEHFKAYYSSPAASENKIFIGNDNGNLYTFDIATGKIIGRFETGSKINSDISVINGLVIFGNNKGNIYCLDTALNLIWKDTSGFKVLSSFTYYNDILFVPTVEGKLLMLGLKNGNIIRELSAGGVITAPPLLHKNRIYIGSYDKHLYCFDAVTGSLIRKYQFEGRIRSSVVVWRDYLLITCDDHNIYCFK